MRGDCPYTLGITDIDSVSIHAPRMRGDDGIR